MIVTVGKNVWVCETVSPDFRSFARKSKAELLQMKNIETLTLTFCNTVIDHRVRAQVLRGKTTTL